MVKFCAYIAFIWLAFIKVSLAGHSHKACKLLEVSTTASDGKVIKVECSGRTIVVMLKEGGSKSMLKVNGEHGRNLLTVEYLKKSHDMFIVIDGKKFEAKNGKTEAEETRKFKKLLDDPEFKSFPKAVRLIHDELQLKGWKSHAVMFLYKMGMATEGYYVKKGKRAGVSLEKRFLGFFNEATHVDPQTYNYHGPHPKEKCTHNGWSDPSMKHLIKTKCSGVCGPSCKKCWKWVCGDCCLHPGCKRHDQFCSSGYFNKDCLSARGVLWDKKTNVVNDCLK